MQNACQLPEAVSYNLVTESHFTEKNKNAELLTYNEHNELDSSDDWSLKSNKNT